MYGKYFVPSFLLLVIFDYCQIHTYTYLSIGNILLNIFLLKNDTMNLLVNLNNFIALSSTFHSSLIFDSNSFVKFQLQNNLSSVEFHIGNFFMHILPIFIMLLLLKQHYDDKTQRFHVDKKHFNIGYYSLRYHLLWCFYTCQTFDLSDVYLYMPSKTWYCLWLYCIIYHIGTGYYITRFMCCRGGYYRKKTDCSVCKCKS